MFIYSCGSNAISSEGIISDKEFKFTETITELEAKSGVKVILSDKLELGEMTVRTNENIHELFVLSDDANKLTIGLVEGNDYQGVEIEITLPSKQFNKIYATELAEVSVIGDAIIAENFYIHLRRVAKFNGKLVISNTLSVDLEGTSVTDIGGSADICDVLCSGSSTVEAKGFTSNSLIVSLDYDSRIFDMVIKESMTGSITRYSAIEYFGTAHNNVEVKGGASITLLEE